MKLPPFIWVAGRPYLVLNFDLEPVESAETPSALVERLSVCQTPFLILRPLSPSERELLERSNRNAAVEAWAQIVVIPSDRYRNRK
jgi:hypothetical protein